MLNLNQFRVTYTAMKLGSFTAAAARLGISQPAVSMQVKNFQDAAGITLYRMDGKRLIPTDVGKKMLDFGDRIFDAATEADDFLMEHKRSRRHRVTIVSTRTIVTYIMPAVMRAFHAANAGAALRVDIGNNDWCYQQVIDGIADFGLLVDSAPHSLLEVTDLFTDNLVLIGSAAFASTSSRLLAMCSEVPVYLREAGSRTRQLTDLVFEEMEMQPPNVMELADVEAIKNAVRAEPSLAVLPSIAVRAEVAAGLFRVHSLTAPSAQMKFQLIRRRGESSPVIRQFLESFEGLGVVAPPAGDAT
jgi:DNA-binding transcriptional LysR family regulator